MFILHENYDGYTELVETIIEDILPKGSKISYPSSRFSIDKPYDGEITQRVGTFLGLYPANDEETATDYNYQPYILLRDDRGNVLRRRWYDCVFVPNPQS